MDNSEDHLLPRIVLFVITIPYWLWLPQLSYSGTTIAICVLGGVAICYPAVWLGRRLLDAKPTQARMRAVTTGVHFGLLMFLGTAIAVAVITAPDWRGWVIPLDRRFSAVLMAITGAIAFSTVMALALRGLGAPFAVALTRQVVIDWLYAWTRNPMVLFTLAFLVALGLWYQSTLFVLWVMAWLYPAFVVFLKVYEERELEIRLGQEYLDYKARTPFMWPRWPQPDAKDRSS